MAMTKKCFFWGPILGFWLLAASVLAAENITIQVHLFRGAWAEDHPGLKEVKILTASSHPAIATLKAKLDGLQSELTAATIDALIAAQDLKTVDEYFVFSQEWRGRAGVFSHDIEHKLYRFKFVYVPRRVSPQSTELKLTIYKSKGTPVQIGETVQKTLAKVPKSEKSGGRMDRLLDTKLLLDFDNPVIVGMPSGEETFFMLLYVRRTSEASGTEGGRPAKSGEKQAAPIEPPKELHTLIPAYPEELRQQRVQGQVGLQVAIDEKGTVIQVKVAKSLHPYLDFAAVQAVRQWTYEPAIQNGKPIPVIVKVAMNFDPEIYRRFEEKAREQVDAAAGEGPASGSLLGKVLDGTADYCRKLAGASLDFICEETIKETHYNFATDPQWAGLVVTSRETGQVVKSTWFPQWDPGRTQKNDYLCDYLFVRKGEKFEERRIILKDNSRTMTDRSRLLEEKRFTALNPVLAAVQLLGRDQQRLFNFRLIQTESLNGRKAFLLEAIPKSGNTWGVEYAKIWVDQSSFQVLRSEIQGIPLEGYDDVLKDAVQFRVRPYLLTTHSYELEKNGVRFPSRSTIRVEYPRRGDFYKDRTLKLKIDMAYDKYKFFTVETEEAVKK
jgi:TonB family protein